MAVDWTAHRFSGGVLALDVANTVVHRDEPSKRFDRFDEPDEIGRFAGAACQFRTAEFGGRPLQVADPASCKPRVIALREATDALFREAAHGGGLDAGKLQAVLRATADRLAGFSGKLPDSGTSRMVEEPLPFPAALAVSALALIPEERWRRIRTCPACGWLFLDKSRNGKRRWCDMTVCGNRQKARLHYRKVRQGGGEADGV